MSVTTPSSAPNAGGVYRRPRAGAAAPAPAAPNPAPAPQTEAPAPTESPTAQQASAQPPVSTPAQAPSAAQPTAPAPSQTAQVRQAQAAATTPADKAATIELQRKELVEFIQSDDVRVRLERVNAALAPNAIKATVTYLTDRNNPENLSLLQCQRESIVDSVQRLLAIGLIADRLTGTAHLVVRKSKQPDNSMLSLCTPVPGVQGWEQKICEAFPRASIESKVFRAQDEIDIVEGLEPRVSFKRNFRPDPSKPNPIIGSYCIIREGGEGGRVYIHTSQITEKATPKMMAGKQVMNGETPVMESAFFNHDGRRVNTSYMGPEAACRYLAQRPAMRAVARVWASQQSTLGKMLAMEEVARNSQEEGGEQMEQSNGRLNLRAKSGPKIEVVAPKSSQTATAPAPAPKEVPVPTASEGTQPAGVSVV